MAVTAFLFPGQGSQTVGMARSLFEGFAPARALFEEADEALGFSLSSLMFEGPMETLTLTEHTQPAILTASVAAFRFLEAQGIRPQFVAGHSLGEYSAVVAAGGLSFADAVRTVRNRGRYMQEAVPAGVGAMAAILKLPIDRIEEICAAAPQGEVVSVANENSPDQTVIAGHRAAVERAGELAKAAGAKRVVMLPVSAPFHCALMDPAQARLQQDLHAAKFTDLSVPLVNNWDAALVQTADAVREGLFQQVPNRVRWVESMFRLVDEGVEQFIEVGPGAVLSGLLRNIDAARKCLRFGEAADWEKLQAERSGP
ncbi:MAG: ACP S-malonyltransferase [Bryobacterales bacterium]|nr:ACP S-malonyltransferase [Bryobacterales bacterium]